MGHNVLHSQCADHNVLHSQCADHNVLHSQSAGHNVLHSVLATTCCTVSVLTTTCCTVTVLTTNWKVGIDGCEPRNKYYLVQVECDSRYIDVTNITCCRWNVTKGTSTSLTLPAAGGM